MLFLSGGTGTPKLIRGFRSLIDEGEMVVVANTADDTFVSGNLVCPDLDTVVYTLAGLIDDDRWWGIEGDSFDTHDFLNQIGQGEYMRIGDLDRAVHIRRTVLLEEFSLSRVTEEICGCLGVEADVFPMTDDRVRTKIVSGGREFGFQEWLVELDGAPVPEKVVFDGLEDAVPSPGFLDALDCEDNVVIGPSNPVTSIYPILSLEGVWDRLLEKNVVAVSPIVDGEPFSGPAVRLMRAFGISPDNYGLRDFYDGLVDCFVYDVRNQDPPGDGVVFDTYMRSCRDEAFVASKVIDLFDEM
ncbi:LPPG:FO 2-phospho-L-lactate transferase F420 biosynthesis enzyme CofD [Methanonatronarchaeum thermophilum]|uniref:LPPG:FO 2-phospho-L-lactate transferase F420 biosynthesis enzyme CofD n=1 Tax=Methanonatronarchaeum thermophilum TaxID=1927129 RepID=A0A1Y3GB68_9EURY|nr:2-phospho-L-lactate transferase [Methanonatronarchaeum thermophilum]OUJ18507.1 LPPG:FO 2-phospho-L-lactate transferase F420 biosynthesis enzyme CofD [Methanonatronarchaeum thermophilum]